MISVETFLMKIHPEFRGEWNYTISPTPRIAAIISQRRQRISDDDEQLILAEFLRLQLDFWHLDSDIVTRPLTIKISEHSHRNDKCPDNCHCNWFHQRMLQSEFFRPLDLIPAMRDPVTGSRPVVNGCRRHRETANPEPCDGPVTISGASRAI
jgi:hypothetical protein